MNVFDLIVSLILWALGFAVAWWALGRAALDEPWNKTITVILVLFTVIVIFGLLTGNVPLIHIGGAHI